MRINTLRTRAGLLILLAMGLTGGGVALWRDARPPLAALSQRTFTAAKPWYFAPLTGGEMK